MDLDEKKQKALEHLRTFPLDYNGCAKILEMEFLEFLEFRGVHLKEFMQVEDESYNRLENLVMMDAMGLDIPKEFKKYDFQKAMKVLACRKGWSATQKVVRMPTLPPESKGIGKKLVDDYLNKKKIGDPDGSGVKILSTDERRNMQ